MSKRVDLRVDDHPDALSISAAENLFIIHYIDGTNALDPAAGRMMIYITKDGASKSCNISFEVDANKNGIFEKGDALVCKEESPNEYGQEQVGKPFSVGVAQRQPDGVNHNVWSGEWAAK